MEGNMEFVMNNIPLVSTLVGISGILFSLVLAGIVKGAPAGNEKMTEIAGAIQEGAIAYLNRQLKSMGAAGAVIFVVIFATMGSQTALGFAIGAVASFLAGYIGMRVSVLANVRTAEAAKRFGCRTCPCFQRRFGYRYDRCRSGTDFCCRILYLHT
jgi:K(+)-stimulated pyrophosphate-energized sodium pump